MVVISPSTRVSSTLVTVTVWGVFQLAVVKERVSELRSFQMYRALRCDGDGVCGLSVEDDGERCGGAGFCGEEVVTGGGACWAMVMPLKIASCRPWLF